jgi:hypothetical protein
MELSQLKLWVDLGLSTYQISTVSGKGQTAVRYWLAKYELGTKRVCKCKCGEIRPEKFTAGRWTCCRKCRGRNQTDIFRQYKRKAVEYKGGCCVRCGYKKCIAALDFHHRNPDEKDPNWRRMRCWTFEKVRKELDKCDLVCSNCHDEIHYGIDGL